MFHIIPVHKTNDKHSLNNYRPVSLLPICGKIFERIIFNDVFAFLENNNLLTLKKKTLWPLFMDGVQLPQGLSHFEEAVYFLPLSSQKFLVLILSTSGG